MSGFLLFLALLGFTSFPAVHEQQTFEGCVNRLPDGTLQLGTEPSGELFLLRGQGNVNVMEEHVGQMIRVTGEITPGAGNNVHATLAVTKVRMLAESCASPLPTARLESVPGKVGGDLVAVPVTSTLAGDQTTSGFQTQASAVQASRQEQPAAPARPDQVAQSEAAANMDASSVDRTEILPGHALGVAELADATTAIESNKSASVPAKSAANPVVVGISGNKAPRLSKSTINIKVGQTVEWLNNSGKVQEIVANPARAQQSSTAALPAGAKPFDSGYVRPDHGYQHRFTVPGVYRYVCELNCNNNPMQVVGEVVVAR